MLLLAQIYLQDVLFVLIRLRKAFCKNQAQKKGSYLMSSIQKPPLPNFSIVGMMPGPELRDLFHFNGTKKRGNEFNRKIDEANDKALADFHKQLDEWKRSQS